MSREPIKNNMGQVMDNSSSTLLFSEVLDKVHKAKTKAQKVKILRDHNNASLRMVIKSSFDPKIEWAMPEGSPPFMPNDAPAGTDHTREQVPVLLKNHHLINILDMQDCMPHS